MVDNEILLTVLTGWVAIATIALAVATIFVYRATKATAKATAEVAKTSKEVGAYTIRPRISVVGHEKIGSDEQHDFYEFRFVNSGVGNAFDLQIMILHKEGFTISPITLSLGINASPPRVIDKSIDKDATEVKFKISYRDIADNPYVQEFVYRFDTGTDAGTYAALMSS